MKNISFWMVVASWHILFALLIFQPTTAQSTLAPCATVTSTAAATRTTAPLVKTATASPTIQAIFKTATACRGDCLLAQTPTQEIAAIPSLSPTPTASPTVSGSRLYRVLSVNGSNIRARASINSPVVGLLISGQSVIILEPPVVVVGYTWGQLADGRGYVAISNNQGKEFLEPIRK